MKFALAFRYFEFRPRSNQFHEAHVMRLDCGEGGRRHHGVPRHGKY